MSFDLDTKSFQEKCWDRLYSELLPRFFKDYAYNGKNVTITFQYLESRNNVPISYDVNRAVLEKKTYYKELRLKTKIVLNKDGRQVETEDLLPLKIPELTKRGFIINGVSYDVVNVFREAYGWYLTVDKEHNLIITLKTNGSGKYTILYKDRQLFVERSVKGAVRRIGLAVLLKAITGLTKDELFDKIDMSNSLVQNTLNMQLLENGIDVPMSKCVVDATWFLSAGYVTKESLATKSDASINRELERCLKRVDISNEGFERYKKFITFQRRASGSMLSKSVRMSNGLVKQEGINLSLMDLIELDNDETVTELYVQYEDNDFTIKKFPATTKEFNSDMILNIASIAFTAFTGLGILDDRDSLENRVIEDVASYIVELVKEYLDKQICNRLDSQRNQGVENMSIFAEEVSKFKNVDFVIQRYKKETSVQMKEYINILSDISKSYKLAYKKRSSDARVGDAVRMIKVKQFMRVCPVDTPESAEVGLNTYLTSTAGVDVNGFITARYIDVTTDKVVEMNALDEIGVPIAVWDADLTQEFVKAHIDGEFQSVHTSLIKYKDVGPTGMLSPSTSFVPFIANNKGRRALMAANMNKQAVKVFGSMRPCVTTASDNITDAGVFRAKDIIMEYSHNNTRYISDEDIMNMTLTLESVSKISNSNGNVRRLKFSTDNPNYDRFITIDIPYYTAAQSGNYSYYNIVQGKTKFKGNDIVYTHRDIEIDNRTIGNTNDFHRAIDVSDDRINECGYGIGVDLKVICKCYKGLTYEDAVVLNKNLFDDKTLTSIYVTELKCELHNDKTKKTRECFEISEEELTFEELDYMLDTGLPKVGSYIKGGQVVICKKKYEEHDAGQSIDISSSVRLDNKMSGWVLDARILEENSNVAVVTIASLNDIDIGDKMVGRHGNKGVIAKIVPAEDMPFTEDGFIPDIILSPLGPIARGNVGQLCEILVGMAGYKMNKRFVIPTLDSADNYETVIKCKETLENDYGFTEKTFYDGETGLPYEKKILAGVMHMYKLVHTAIRPSKVIGSSTYNVRESNQQPRDGQRISELQVNSLIAHGATEVIDSLFSVQSDDIKSGSDLHYRIIKGGNSTALYDAEISGDNKSNEMVRAYLRTLGVDVLTREDNKVGFFYLTDEDILNISGHDKHNVVEAISTNEPVVLLHNEEIFGAESRSDSRKLKNRSRRRNNYGRFEFGVPVIMPIIFRNTYFLMKFRFIEWEFSVGSFKGKSDDGISTDEQFLRISCKDSSISLDIVSKLISGKFTRYCFNSESMSFFNTEKLDELENEKLQKQALEFLDKLHFDTNALKDKHYKNKFYSNQRIDKLADMFYFYDSTNRQKANEICKLAIDEYDKILERELSYSDYDTTKFDFINKLYDVINCNDVGMNVVGREYFVTKMLIMPTSFRARFFTDSGERYNYIDATYAKILNRINDLQRSISDRRGNKSANISRLYEALDSCYKKPEGSKNNISITSLLLASDIDKRSTVIRGSVGAKRVSYSCRSVISVNPDLKLTECGIPYKHALKLWEDNIIYRMTSPELTESVTNATGEIYKMETIKGIIRYLIDGNYYAIGHDILLDRIRPIETAKSIEKVIIKCLCEVMKDEIVILNREPSLHKFNSLAFIPVLVSGLAIQLNPLVCTAYNADFDGDTMMAVALMIETAKREARDKMMTINNIINPKDGSNLLAMKQDIVLGLYMLTMMRDNGDEVPVSERIPRGFFNDVNIIEQYIDNGLLSIYDIVCLTVSEKEQKSRRSGSGEKKEYSYVSTAGRIIFNSLLNNNSGFTKENYPDCPAIYKLKYDERVNGKKANKIVTDYFESTTNNSSVVNLIDTFKDVGIKYADKSGITLSINDFDDKSYLVHNDIVAVQEKVDKYDTYAKLKIFPQESKKEAVIKLWEKELKTIQGKIEDSMDKSGSVFQIIDSGARGDKSDYNTIAGIVGQVRNVDETIVERPILGNYIKGLTADEYFISTYAARRGQISTSTKTADSGKNNRDISRLLANVKVVREDCGVDSYKLRLKYGELLESCVNQIVCKEITNCKYEQFIGKVIVKNLTSNGNEVSVNDIEKTQLLKLELDGTEMTLQRKLNDIHRSLLLGRVVNLEENSSLIDRTLKSIAYDGNDSLADEMIITETTLDCIENNPIEYLNVRLLIGCQAHGGVCSKCYGKDIETKRLIAKGKYIGLIAATGISEVVTQSTMDVNHAKASQAGTSSTASDFKNALSAKEKVKVSEKQDDDGNKYYSVSMLNKFGDFEQVEEGVNADRLPIVLGIAADDGIINITDIVKDKKSIVRLLTSSGTVYNYELDKRSLIVNDGEEVRKFQPIINTYDYNVLMKMDRDFTREFYILDFANIFYRSGKKIRAIHFETIGREQTNHKLVKYTVNDSELKEAFPSDYTEEQIYDDLQGRYDDCDVRIRSVDDAVLSRNELMDSSDIIANAFGEEMFSKVGKYCMNKKADECTSPLTNLYLGKKVDGSDNKEFLTTGGDNVRDTVQDTKDALNERHEVIGNDELGSDIDEEMVDIDFIDYTQDDDGYDGSHDVGSEGDDSSNNNAMFNGSVLDYEFDDKEPENKDNDFVAHDVKFITIEDDSYILREKAESIRKEIEDMFK